MDFAQICAAHGLIEPVSEFRFAPPRKWRFDWAWPEWKLAVEIEGGAWVRGRHNRGKGFIGDLEKYNAATILGWAVLRVTPQHVHAGQAIAWIREWAENQKEKK